MFFFPANCYFWQQRSFFNMQHYEKVSARGSLWLLLFINSPCHLWNLLHLSTVLLFFCLYIIYYIVTSRQSYLAWTKLYFFTFQLCWPIAIFRWLYWKKNIFQVTILLSSNFLFLLWYFVRVKIIPRPTSSFVYNFVLP